ncbi:MAG: 4-hydroxythreonine-4-phosphate dehydrogenase PdxA, partial [Neisseria sp.]|nr:4-hydroxythreonine-4-phosphate dehydrogenase PdxA [Neisseria sp.]
MTNNLPTLAITSGEPAGIGPDICLDLANHKLPCRLVVLADKYLLQQRAEQLGKTVRLVDYQANAVPPADALEVLHIPLAQPCQAGTLNVANAPYVLQLLDRAYAGIQAGEFAGMVTAPLHKGIINEAGGAFFSGHTEYLAEKSNTKRVVMMLAGGGLRVALVTTHLPLKDVATAISSDLVEEIARILHHDLRHKFGISNPRILVAGLNPHAGEGGHLGWEEIEIIQPALA